MGLRVLTAHPYYGDGPGQTHLWASRFDEGSRRAEATAVAALTLREEGWIPNIVWAHPAWGDALLLKEIFPEAPILSFVEWCHGPTSDQVGFDPEHCAESLTDCGMASTAPAMTLLSSFYADAPYVSTRTAVESFPIELRPRLRVLHEGIPTKYFSRQPKESSLGLLRTLAPSIPEDAPLLTYLSRGYELSRGFHSFLRSLAIFQKLQPRAHAVVMGSDDVSYGKRPACGRTWREVLLAELDQEIDLSRVHWLPYSPRNFVRALYSVSDCHVYLTSPIQLSLSPLEATSCLAPLVTNECPQTKEFVAHNESCLTADFFDYQAIAEACSELIDNRQLAERLAAAGRESVIEKVDLSTVVMPKWEMTFWELSAFS